MAARVSAILLLLALPGDPDRILSDGVIRGFYGESFALADVNGDGVRDLVVGAPGWPDGSSRIGRASLHLGGAEGPSASPAWTSSGDAAAQSSFGRQVVAAGDVNGDGFGDVLVGAQSVQGQDAFDKVFLFLGTAGGLASTPAWSVTSGNRLSFDWAGDVDGDGFGDVVLGWGDGVGGGTAVLHNGHPGGLSEGASWVVDGYGGPVAGASDVNGDGFADVLAVRGGAVDVFHGSAGGPSTSPATTLEGDNPADPQGGFTEDFGMTLADAGDVNGDGFPDVLVGAPGVGTGNPFNHGAAYLFLGSSSGLRSPYAWKFTGAARADYVGTAVAAAGDVNGDGFADVVVGATDPLVPRNGAAHVFHGEAAALGASPAWTVRGSAATERLGTAVGGAPLNGDGLSDVVLGSPFAATGSDPGRVLLFHARPDAPPPTAPVVDPPADLAQASHPGGDPRPAGFTDDDPSMAFRGVVAVGDDGGWLEVEVKPAGEAFDGTSVRMGNAVSASAGLSEVTFTDLADGPYHWRARTAAAEGGRSDWVAFAPDALPDFSIDTTGAAPATADPPAPAPSPPAPADPAGGGGTNPQVFIDDDDDDDCGALGAELLLLLLAIRRIRRGRPSAA